MTSQNGRDLLLKIGDGASPETFTTIGAARTVEMSVTNPLTDVTSLADGGMATVQAGGGVREHADLRRLFDAGVTRVVVGSVAIRDPERVAGWLREHGAERPGGDESGDEEDDDVGGTADAHRSGS